MPIYGICKVCENETINYECPVCLKHQNQQLIHLIEDIIQDIRNDDTWWTDKHAEKLEEGLNEIQDMSTNK